jgi:transcriptional regulator with XRE-family HTH domain
VQIHNLREWRERRALTQEELAEQAGVSARSVAGYEAGTGARPGTVRKLAAALDISVEDLLGKAEAPPSLEPTLFNGLEGERRTSLQRSWRDFITLLASQIKSEAESKGYAPSWILQIDAMPRFITKSLFDNEVLGSRETYPTESEWRQSWAIVDALDELDEAVEQAWRGQMQVAEGLEQAREADQLRKKREEKRTEDKNRKESLKALHEGRSARA